jgi:hypothetical protein
MRRQIVLLSIVGFFGLLAIADAQTPSASTAGAAFDGTYQLVSSTKVNPKHTSSKGDMAPCPDRTPGPLTIAQGQARYTAETGYELQAGRAQRRAGYVIDGRRRWRLPPTGDAHDSGANRRHWQGIRPPDR